MPKSSSDSELDAMTSSSDQDSSDKESDNNDSDYDGKSYKSLTFNKNSRRTTTHLKSKKTGKRVRFKPGDSLVLIYIIPNREMLGLKSASEDSDDYYEESDEESGDEENEEDNVESSEEEEDDNDDDEDDDLKDDSDDESEVEDEEGEDNDTDENKNVKNKPRPFAKLLAARQVSAKRKPPLPSIKPTTKLPEKSPKQVNMTNLNEPSKVKKKTKRYSKRKEKKPVKSETQENTPDNRSRSSRRKQKLAAAEKDKPLRHKRSRSRIIEINATIEGKSVGSVPRVLYKQDLKPSVVDVNGASVSSPGGQKTLINRSRMQSATLRVATKGARPNSAPKSNTLTPLGPIRPNSAVRRSVPVLPSIDCKSRTVSRVVSGSYESLTSVLPDSYLKLNSLQTDAADGTLDRLDPDCMNSDGKRHYAWQIANGTITSKSLRTPSILPFWDSLQGQQSDKLPTQC